MSDGEIENHPKREAMSRKSRKTRPLTDREAKAFREIAERCRQFIEDQHVRPLMIYINPASGQGRSIHQSLVSYGLADPRGLSKPTTLVAPEFLFKPVFCCPDDGSGLPDLTAVWRTAAPENFWLMGFEPGKLHLREQSLGGPHGLTPTGNRHVVPFPEID